MPKINRKGVQGRRIKLDPEKEQGLMLALDIPIQRGKVIGAGKESMCKVGDTVIVSDWLIERIQIGNEISYYVTDDAILEIL